MKTIFRYALSRSRGQILGWGIGLGLYSAYLVSFYDTLAAQSDQIISLLEAYPKEMLAFFGSDMADFLTPSGYVGIYLFSYMTIILGIFAVQKGSNMLVSDEESGELDLLLAHPVSRTAFFMGRLLNFVVATTAILGIMWLGVVLALSRSSLDVTRFEILMPMLSLMAVLLVFGTIALLLSLVLPSRRMAAMVAGLVLVASFLIDSLVNLDERLVSVNKFLPLHYFQGGDALDGLNLASFFGLLAAAALFSGIAWWRFERRDIRVGGESGWRFVLPWRRDRVAQPVTQAGVQAEA